MSKCLSARVPLRVLGGLAPLASLDPKSVFCLLKIGPLVRFFLLVLPGRGGRRLARAAT